MTILTGSLTSLRLSGSSLVQRKDTGAEVLMDLDFTSLPDQALTDKALNGIGGFQFYIDETNSPEWVRVVNGTGLAFRGTTNKTLKVLLDLTGAFPQIQIADRIRMVAQFGITNWEGAGDPAGDTIYLGFANGYAAADEGTGVYNSYTYAYSDYNNSVVTNKYIFGSIYQMLGAAAVNAHNITDATPTKPTALRLSLDGTQENWYTAGDFNTTSPGGLTDFPIPGDIEFQGRLRMQSNTGMPKLINTYQAPYTGSFQAWVEFRPNITEISASLQRLTIFRFGAN